MDDFRQIDSGEYQCDHQHHNSHNHIREREVGFLTFGEKHHTHQQRSTSTSQAIEGLSQIQTAGGGSTVAQLGHIRIGSRFKEHQATGNDKQGEQEEVERHVVFARNEQQRTNAEQQQTEHHSLAVAVAGNKKTGRDGHDKIAQIKHDLYHR